MQYVLECENDSDIDLSSVAFDDTDREAAEYDKRCR